MIATVIFVEICDATDLYERHGQQTVAGLVGDGQELIVSRIRATGGTVVRIIGATVLAKAPDPDTAFGVACSLQEAVADQSFSIRIGFHHGTVVPHEGDIYGDTVNTAARISTLAKADEILTSEPTVRKLSPNLRNRVRRQLRTAEQ